jgi:hypothetical protein
MVTGNCLWALSVEPFLAEPEAIFCHVPFQAPGHKQRVTICSSAEILNANDHVSVKC